MEPYVIPRIGEKISIDNQWKSIADIRYTYNDHKIDCISIVTNYLIQKEKFCKQKINH